MTAGISVRELAHRVVQQVKLSKSEEHDVQFGCSLDGHKEDFVDIDEGDIEETEARVTTLLEHILFDHASSGDLLIIRTAVVASSLQLRLLAGVPAMNEYEERWRESHNDLPYSG